MNHVKLLDQGFIELIDSMPDFALGVSGDKAIVDAARVSFLGESKGDEADKKLLFRLMKDHHTSPFETVMMKWAVRAPLIVWWQWARHRTWHYNAQSGRYTPFEEGDFYMPDKWRKQSRSNKQGSDGLVDDADSNRLTKALTRHYDQCFAFYTEALEMGVAKEQARLFLPGFSVYYTWVVSVDVHNLMGFLRLRMAPDAQEEIRVYANAIYKYHFKPLMPWTAEAFEQYVLIPNNIPIPE